MNEISQPYTLQLIKDLIDLKMPKKGSMTLINGINFGCQYEGYYDHPIGFFQKISSKFFMDQSMNMTRRQEFMQSVTSIKLDDFVMNFLMRISSKSDISPNAFIKILLIVHDVIHIENKEFT